MFKRREFLTISGAAGLASLTHVSPAAQPAAQGAREYYLLQQYQLDDEAQRKRFDTAMQAAVPALNRAGVRPVGVFYPEEGVGPAYVLLPGKSAETLLGLVDKLLADSQYVQAAADVLGATAESAGFKRLESSLLLAFRGMPELQTPVQSPGRVFQLRIYESPSVKTAKKKIEMFNDAGELAIFRRVGLKAVFFGETLVGPKMPNLTYMLSFGSREEQQAAWQAFRSDPDWLKLKGMAEYADKTILCGITNLLLKPAAYSQI
mgnify:CR=1 FL=1